MSVTATKRPIGRRALRAGLLLLASCASGRPVPERAPTVRAAPGVRRFDLVPRGYDDNGLGLDPELGFAFNQRCGNGGDTSRDPSTCSWRFIEAPRLPMPSRVPCNSRVMDPDFSTVGFTDLAITCSDSPLRYPGHVNWGAGWGAAVTYEGWLNWEGYSGKLPFGDEDFNFVLTLDDQRGKLSPQWDWIGLEYNSREAGGFASPWWTALRKKAYLDDEETSAYVGTVYAIVTGLLGIDAEHMSLRDPSIELHPVFAMALKACNDAHPCPAGTDRWALFVRDQGNEGMCSHFERPHVLPLFRGGHSFRLPGRANADPKIGKDTRFCSSGEGEPSVVIRADPGQGAVLVTVKMPPGGIVDGDLWLEWTGSGAERASLAADRARQRRYRPRPGAEKEPAEFRVSRVRQSHEERSSFEAGAERACKEVKVTLETGPLPPAKRTPAGCSALPPTSADRTPESLGATGVAERRKRVEPRFELPQDVYCKSRAAQSDLAKEYCAEREAGY